MFIKSILLVFITFLLSSCGDQIRLKISQFQGLTLPVSISIDNNLTAINISNNTSYTVSGTCSHPGSSNIQITFDSALPQSTDCLLNNTFTHTSDLSSLGDSTITIEATINGPLLQTAISNISILKDTLRPTTLSILSPASSSTISSLSFNMSGACEPFANITITGPGLDAAPYSATCIGAGTYSIPVTLLSGDGVKAFSINEVDTANNSINLPLTGSYTLDTTLPSVTITSSPTINLSNQGAYTVSGTCSEATRDINYSIGIQNGVVTCSATNVWTVTLNVSGHPDSPSIPPFRADHSDASGNNAPQASVALLKDTVRPTIISLTSPTNLSNLNSTSQTMVGTCEANSSLSISGAGLSSIATGTCSSAGAFSIGVNLTAAQGSKAFAISQIDTASNSMSPPLSGSYNLDTVLPTVTIGSPSIINLANQSSYTLSGTCSEPSRDVSYNIGGVTGTTSCSGANTWSVTTNVSTTSDSLNLAIAADHTDASANSANQATVTVLKDTVRPTPLTLSSPAPSSNLNSTSQTMTGTCEPAATVSILGPGITGTPSGVCSGAGTYSIAVTLTSSQGVKSYGIEQTDVALNNMATTLSGSYNLDTIIPTVTITSSPPINIANEGSYTFSGTCSEPTRDVVYNLQIQNGVVTCSGANTWTVTVDTSGHSDTLSLNLRANHTDSFGNNANQASIFVLKDTVRPTSLTLTNPTDTSTVGSTSQTLNGACEAGATVSISGAGVSGTPTTTCLGGSTYSLAVTLTSGDGLKAFNLDQTDTAGNSMASALSASLTLSSGVSLANTETVDTNVIGAGPTSTSYEFDITTSGSNRLLILSVSCHTNSHFLTSATYNSLALAKLTNSQNGTLNVETWYLINPTIGTNTLNMQFSDDPNNKCAASAHNFINVNQITPFSNTQTGINSVAANYNIPLSLTSAQRGYVFAANRDNAASNFVTVPAQTDILSTDSTLTAIIGIFNGTGVIDPEFSTGHNRNTYISTQINNLFTAVSLDTLPNIIATNQTSYTISGRCSLNGKNVYYNIASGTITGNVNCSSNTWSITLDLTSITDSLNVPFLIDHNDGVGDNAPQVSQSVVKDTTPPGPPTIVAPLTSSKVPNTSVSIHGGCETGATVSVSGADIVSGPFTSICVGSSYSVNTIFTPGDGLKSFSVNQTDTYQNSSTSLAASYTLDTTLTPNLALSVSSVTSSASITVPSASNQLLIVSVAGFTDDQTQVQSVKYDNIELNLLNFVGSNSNSTWTYYLLDPKPGTFNITIESTLVLTPVLIADLFTSTDMAIPFGTVNSSASSSNSISTTLSLSDSQLGYTTHGVRGQKNYSMNPLADKVIATANGGLDYIESIIFNSYESLTRIVNPTATFDSGSEDTSMVSFAINKSIARETVTSVTTLKADGDYTDGEVIDILVNFSDTVTVNTAGGTPYLEIATNNINGLAQALYISGSGSNQLTFRYTVSKHDYSSDLDYQSSSSLKLNGSTIKDTMSLDINPILPRPSIAGSISNGHAITISPTIVTASASNHTITDSFGMSSKSINVRTIGLNRLLLLSASCKRSDEVITATYNGSALTELVNELNSDNRLQVFYIKNPTVSTNTLFIDTDSIVSYCDIHTHSYLNVDQTTSFGSVTTATDATTSSTTNTTLSITSNQAGYITYSHEDSDILSFSGAPYFQLHTARSNNAIGSGVYYGVGAIDPIISNKSNDDLSWTTIVINTAP